MKKTKAFLLLLLTLSGCSSYLDIHKKQILSEHVYGVTIDRIDRLPQIKDSLSSLPQKPTTRIVFDEFVPAKNYKNAVKELHQVSYIQGELLDSFYVKKYSLTKYKARAKEYVELLGSDVDIWEIGNEINGEWLGNAPDVVSKIQAALDVVEAASYDSAITLYYNKDCWEKPQNEMFRWVETNLSISMRSKIDYVWVSYYEDDCNGLKPNWDDIFNKLAPLFPNSKLGVGEAGTTKKAKKSALIKEYYTRKVTQPKYVGGVFWWYYWQDAVPKTKTYWTDISNAIKTDSEARAY